MADDWAPADPDGQPVTAPPSSSGGGDSTWAPADPDAGTGPGQWSTDAGHGSVPQAIGTGVIKGVPLGSDIAAVGLPAVKNYVAPVMRAIARPINRALGVDQDALDKEWDKADADLPSTYLDAKKRLKAATDEAGKAHPFVQTAAELGTGAAVVPFGATSRALTSAAAPLSVAGRLAPRIAGTAGTAGLYSGLYGAGEGDTLSDRAVNAGKGAATGAVLGAAAEPAAAAIGKVAQGVKNFAGFYDPAERAGEQVSGALQKDLASGRAGMSPQDVADAKASGQTPILADRGGQNIQDLARVAADTSPDARAALTDATVPRFQDQSSRFKNFTSSLFPGKQLNTAVETDRIASEARAANDPAYQKAYNAPNAGAMWDQDFANLTRSPAVQSAIGDAQDKAANYAVLNKQPIPQNPFVRAADGSWQLRTDAQGNAVGIPSLRFWDQVKRSLDDIGSTARRGGNNEQAADIGNITGMLKGKLDSQVPQYAQARATAARYFGQNNAVDGAQAFDSASDENTINTMMGQLRTMQPADREVFARAYAAQLQQKMANPAASVDLARQFSSPALQAKMTAGLNTASNPLRAQQMEAFVRRENLMNLTKNAVTGGPNTAQRLASQAQHGTGHGGGLTSMITSQFSAPGAGAIGGALGGYHLTPEDASWENTAGRMAVGAGAGALMGYLVQHRGQANEETMRMLGEQLSSPDPDVYEKALKRVAANPQFMQTMRRAEAALTPLYGQSSGSGQNQAQ